MTMARRSNLSAVAAGRPASGEELRIPHLVARALHIKDSCPWRGTPEDEKLGQNHDACKNEGHEENGRCPQWWKRPEHKSGLAGADEPPIGANSP